MIGRQRRRLRRLPKLKTGVDALELGNGGWHAKMISMKRDAVGTILFCFD